MQEKKEDNSVYIGKKPFKNYVIASMMTFKRSGSVVIKARGKYISRAVDVAQVVIKSLKAEIEGTKLGTEQFEDKKQQHKISTIEITIKKVS